MTYRASIGLAFLCFASAWLGSGAQVGDVVINEVAWGGGPLDAKAEWIELLNVTGEPIAFDGWLLTTSDTAPTVRLHGVIPPRSIGAPDSGLFLLERGNDNAVPSIPADQIYEGALTDAGEILYLYDADGQLIDSANASPISEASGDSGDILPGPLRGWPAGSGAPAYCTMERVDPLLPDSRGNWATHSEAPDASTLLCGTPRQENGAFNVPPTPVMSIEPRVPMPAEAVSFSAVESTDANDRIEAYAWSFGDGSVAEGQTASHTYEQSGTYEVSLIVRDSKGETTELARALIVRPLTPPLADFSLLPSSSGDSPRAGTELSFIDESSHDSGDILAYVWDLGDGATEEGTRVAHTYEAAGLYDVRLTVTDDRGLSAQAHSTIIVASRTPTAAFTFSSDMPDAGTAVTLDASASSDPDGSILLFHWDFDGDGILDLSTDTPTVDHVFDVAGPQEPTLIVEDDSEDRSTLHTQPIYVNALPIAQFSVSSFAPEELETVLFEDLSHDPDGSIASWTWDFGDGATSVQTAPSHVFEASGTHEIGLTVTDDRGASQSAMMTIHVENLPPVALLDVTPASEGDTGTRFRLDASASSDPSPEGSIVRYAWDLDGDSEVDEETSTPSLSHTFADDGTYEVSVRVTDDDGATATSELHRINVRNRPPIVRSIAWQPTRPVDGEAVTFSAVVEDPDGSVVQWSWTLGAEATSGEESPIHSFARNEIYSVQLLLIDDDGAHSETFRVDVNVDNAEPTALFTHPTVDDLTVLFNAQSSFDPSPEGRIVHTAWDFGDGTACPEQPSSCGGLERETPLHRFPAPGAYTVTLVVIDDEGSIGRVTRVVTVF